MNAFELIVYAIAALVFILVVIGVFQQFLQPENPLTQIKKSIELAQTQTMLGHTVENGYLDYPNDFTAFARNLADKKNTIVSFECNNPSDCCIRKTDANSRETCTKAIDWDYDFVKINQPKKISTNTRCVLIQGMPVCKVYLGTLPAQAKVFSIDSLGTNLGATQIKITLKNTGSIQISYGTVRLELYKKSINGWELTDYNSSSKEVPLIVPQEKHILFWDITPNNIGEYKAEFIFDAQNGGSDQNFIIFTKETNSYCAIDGSPSETVQNMTNGTYEEIHYCTGCSYSHECVGAWSKETPSTTFYPQSKDQTYCTKSTFEGNC